MRCAVTVLLSRRGAEACGGRPSLCPGTCSEGTPGGLPESEPTDSLNFMLVVCSLCQGERSSNSDQVTMET